jgi:hypothetical protein
MTRQGAQQLADALVLALSNVQRAQESERSKEGDEFQGQSYWNRVNEATDGLANVLLDLKQWVNEP